MKNYSLKQIAIWESSLATVFDNGYIVRTPAPGHDTLLSLFVEGFGIAAKRSAGNMCVFTAAGVKIEIHSKSLARALRKRYNDHKRDMLKDIKQEMDAAMKRAGINDSLRTNLLAGYAGCNMYGEAAQTDYFLVNSPTRFSSARFTRPAWNRRLEFCGLVEK